MKALLAYLALNDDGSLPEKSNIQNVLHYFSLLNTPRRGWIDRGIPLKFAESTYEHNNKGRKAFTIYTFGKMSIDDIMLGALKFDMHDLTDAIALDVIPGDNYSKEEKFKLEENAMKTICSDLKFGPQLMKWFYELHENKTLVDNLLHDFDKMDTSPQSQVYINGFDNIINYYNNNPLEFEKMRIEKYKGISAEKVFDAMFERLHEFHPYNKTKVSDPFLSSLINEISDYKEKDVYQFYYSMLSSKEVQNIAVNIRERWDPKTRELKQFLYQQTHLQVNR